MKKFNKFELIGIGISLLLICIFISLIGKHVFNLEGDYLSAASTLFASVIAFILFNDWKDQHKVHLLEKYHAELKKHVENLLKSKKLISDEYFKFIISKDKNLMIDSPLTILESQIKDEYQSIDRLINEYLIYLETLGTEKFIKQHKEQVLKLITRIPDILNDFLQIAKEYDLEKQYMNLIKSLHNGEQYKFIMELQIFSEFALSPFYFEYLNSDN
ncbi:hypothetical protein PA3_33180 [Acinetobacter pittii]|uniref:Uncharacterized protein n=1 Tax=Acinetobacter pittii TaxID=48296 RepID=A0A4Y3JEQ3_ACIPI|nr:hypothetical protein [Acinetobacter pittii]GEA69160.1 hypothetical protein PA3_33180 [Acinetobacter pittii]